MPDMSDHRESSGDVVEHLADVFAEPRHDAAAGGAGASRVLSRLVHDFLPRQMVGQRLVFDGGLTDRLGLAGFQLFEPQLDLVRPRICGGAYAPPPVNRHGFVTATSGGLKGGRG
jgi:hypothetical protein